MRLQTPTLDKEKAGILDQISSQGGYAFIRMITTGDARAAREMAWEQLYSGPWHSVLPVWRDAYAMACLYVANSLFDEGQVAESLKVLDMGLIMGGDLLRPDFQTLIQSLVVFDRQKNISAGRCSNKVLYSSDDFNQHEATNILPLNSLSSKLVTKCSCLSIEGFLRDYFIAGIPVIISDSMSHWPARSRWNSLEYLNTVAGHRTVPVEVGKNYLSSEWKQEMITFSEFLERIQSGNFSVVPTTYLAQHQLFDQVKELRKDVVVPDYCYAGGGEMRSINAWFGPAATVTPLHHDPHHNILAQVVGKKYIRLYPASLCEELYPHSETMLCNSSQVDLDNIDEDAFPKARELDFVDCILDEGEMLYIPPKWWHYVRSLTTSLSVSFWWSNPEGSP